MAALWRECTGWPGLFQACQYHRDTNPSHLCPLEESQASERTTHISLSNSFLWLLPYYPLRCTREQKEEGGGGKEEREGTGRGVEGGKGMRTSGLPLQESAFLFQEREEERWARGKMEEEGEEGKVGVEGKEKGKGRRGRKGEEGRAEEEEEITIIKLTPNFRDFQHRVKKACER